ncbi:hypothetical protein [Piscinibacter koreensis]|jgi:hypothetical protein|uniref:Uncharacterized protein n=1 Tax=Piscinibacter koreensis TaxID=2742824 RepID=A0A7Y6NNC1_9BURK|nr:hypothetical protein [Schlegelella koreensis]MDX9741937.1 hypothetical protein [Gammaproteobacteria bacterium]NUZ06361.1 hypothetical protein [Schlegelella koreensis]
MSNTAGDEDPSFLAAGPGGELAVVHFPHDAAHHYVPPKFRLAPSSRGTVIAAHPPDLLPTPGDLQ